MAQKTKVNVNITVNAEIGIPEKLVPIVNENGEEIYEAPIVIHSKADLENYHITWDDCKTLHFGRSKKGVVVYFFPTTNKELAEFHWQEINTAHSQEYRKDRCLIPGKLKPLIKCPDSNSCRNCPYPEYRDRHLPDDLSWERLEEDGYEIPHRSNEMRQSEARMAIDDVCKVISQRNPKYALAIYLFEYRGYSAEEIAKLLKVSVSSVYQYIAQAKKIGKNYNGGTENV